MKLVLRVSFLFVLVLSACLLMFINATTQFDLLLRNLRFGTEVGLVVPLAFLVSSLFALVVLAFGVRRRWSWIKSITVAWAILLVVGVMFLPTSLVAGII